MTAPPVNKVILLTAATRRARERLLDARTAHRLAGREVIEAEKHLRSCTAELTAALRAAEISEAS